MGFETSDDDENARNAHNRVSNEHATTTREPTYFVSRLREMVDKKTLCLIAVDEAHCVSQWGHDFRAAYRALCAPLLSLHPARVFRGRACVHPHGGGGPRSHRAARAGRPRSSRSWWQRGSRCPPWATRARRATTPRSPRRSTTRPRQGSRRRLCRGPCWAWSASAATKAAGPRLVCAARPMARRAVRAGAASARSADAH